MFEINIRVILKKRLKDLEEYSLEERKNKVFVQRSYFGMCIFQF